MKSCYRFVGAVALFSLVACGGKQVEYLPFQESEDGYWGLIDRKGKVLFADEFENEIEGVSDGMLLTTNDDGMYQYFTVAKKPKLIGEEYKYAGDFYDGIAPVAKKDEWIQFINKKGNVVFELKEIEGKQVKSVEGFYFGVAIYRLEDDTYGLIDTKGNVLTKPRYGEIGFCSSNRFYGFYSSVIENEMLYVDYDDAVLLFHYKDFIDGKKDKALFKLEYNKHEIHFYDNSKLYCIDTEKKHIIMDGNKEVLKLSKDSKNANIYDIMGKYMLFENENGNKQGVMDLKGNIVIRPKYQVLEFMDETTFVCSTNGTDYKVINIKDDVINNDVDVHEEAYAGPVDFRLCDGIVCWANGDEDFYFADKKGEPINNDTYNVVLGRRFIGCKKVFSDFYNINELINQLDITEYGIGGVSINNTVDEFVEFDNKDSYYEIDINDYVREDELDFYEYYDGVKVEFYPSFDGYIAVNAVSEYGGQSVWNEDCKLDKLLTGFYLTGQLENRGDAIYKGLSEFFTTMSVKHVIGECKASFRFNNSKDLRLSYNKEKGTMVLIYCNFAMSDESFYSVNE